MDRNRHELKYYINKSEFEIIKGTITQLLKLDTNSGRENEYTISSLYFDDIYNSSFNEKLEGLEIRKKYRIRVYNGNDDNIKLEKKGKRGSMINKQACKLSRDDYYSILSGKVNSKKYNNVVYEEFAREMVLNCLRPKVIVEYEREAYVADTSELRITFDKNLRAVYNSLDLFGRNNAGQHIFPEGIMILEVKFNSILPDYIRGVLTQVDKQSLAISKYVICREKYNEMKGI